MHGQIHTGIHAHIVIDLTCLAHVQDLAMKSAWESSRGPEQDTETEAEREKERGRLLSPDKILLFICPTLSFPSSLHTSLLYHLLFLSYFFGNHVKPSQAYQVNAACQSLWNPNIGQTRYLMPDLATPQCLKQTGCTWIISDPDLQSVRSVQLSMKVKERAND